MTSTSTQTTNKYLQKSSAVVIPDYVASDVLVQNDLHVHNYAEELISTTFIGLDQVDPVEILTHNANITVEENPGSIVQLLFGIKSRIVKLFINNLTDTIPI